MSELTIINANHHENDTENTTTTRPSREDDSDDSDKEAARSRPETTAYDVVNNDVDKATTRNAM
jgi:hypothetical protein